MLRDLLTRATWFGGNPTSLPLANTLCLGIAARLALADEAQLAAIVARLFPERAETPTAFDACWPEPLRTSVRFNDHPETTWEDVDKVLTVYEQETRG